MATTKTGSCTLQVLADEASKEGLYKCESADSTFELMCG